MIARRPLDEALASPSSRQAYVRRLFATIAPRYDLITVLLSYGQDRRWKRRLAGMAGVRSGQTVLDLACGTGDITFMLAEKGGKVTGLDVTLGMLQRARARQKGAEFVCADMMALPFAGAGFDVVTAGYGLRNVPDLVPALGEVYRMLRPGGVFLSLDFNRPENVLVREVYLAYLNLVGAGLGLALHRDPDTYRYIPASIRRYPGARRVADLMCQQGFSDCEYVPVLGGLMAIHRARKPVHPS